MVPFIQIPTDVPHPVNNTPVDFNSWIDVLVYIVVPLLALGFYFFYRRKKSNRGKDKDLDGKS